MPKRHKDLEPLRHAVEGVVVFIDLDRFEEEIERRGWSKWKPNEATGLMTQLAESLARKWRAVVVYGLDPERGTEEVILEVPFARIEDVLGDLEEVRREIESLGVTVSIAVVEGLVGLKPARDRREAYYGTPARRRATELLRRAKAMGGNRILTGYSA